MDDDEKLVAEYLDGDEGAYAALVERHLRSVYAFAMRFTQDSNEAEDVVQESFLKAWKSLKKFDAKKARFKTWLMSIARNTAIDHLRRRKNTPFVEFDTDGNNFSESIADETPLPDEIAARKDDVAALERALMEISVRHREVLLLYNNGNDFTFQEIATILGESMNTVKSRYRRAVEALTQALMHQK